MDTENLIREKIAKCCFQYAFFIADQKIDEEWRFIANKDKWFYCAGQILALIKEDNYVRLADPCDVAACSKMTGQELKEKIAKVLAGIVIEAIKHSDVDWVFDAPDYVDQIITHFREAGYISPEEARHYVRYDALLKNYTGGETGRE